ncbi:hypothetical protein LA6_003951 [Marinibacterium anthonyi]|nr:hypothetical protein LA6_003951 [Marinibacterium anthonyi]
MKPTGYLALTLAAALAASPLAAAETWTPWADLGKFKPDQKALIDARTERNPGSKKEYEVQLIAEGLGEAVNVDEYVVQITKLPTGMSKDAFFKHVRVNLNDFLDQFVSTFGPYDTADRTDWNEGRDAQLGTIMVFGIALPVLGTDDGAVVVSQTKNFQWTFSPVKDGFFGSFGTHPVAGNRQFGLREVAGRYEFYTRAFDRVYPTEVDPFEEEAFKGADDLWKSLQNKLVAYVNKNGGTATALTPTVPGGNDPDKKPQYSDVCKDATLNLKC